MYRISDEVPIFTLPALKSVVDEPVCDAISEAVRSWERLVKNATPDYPPGLAERILDAKIGMEPLEIQQGYRLSLRKHSGG